MINYFAGILELGTFDFELEKKIHVSGKISERWEQLLSRSISCGEEKKRTLERRVGISKTEREDLESLVKGSIGVKGIASVESQIKAKTGDEVTFEYKIVETEETTFKAPACGRVTLMVYQKVREYDMTITDTRFFSKGQTRILLTEYTNHIHDESIIDSEPNCGCKKTPIDADDGLLSLLLNQNYQLVTPYKLTGEKINLKNLDLEISVEDLGNIMLDRFTLPSNLLPKYVIFFSGIKQTEISIGLNIEGSRNRTAIELSNNYAELIPEVGEIYEGKVTSVLPYGAFVEIMPGKDGLLHISEIDHNRIETMDGIFEIGDEVRVKLLDIDDQGKLKLSRKAVLPRPEKSRE